jgi:predicted AlkP superfamily phosphohydrolase/phosphomutase
MKRLYRNRVLSGRATRKCFALPYDEHCGAIRLNIKGREKHGKLAPGTETKSFCQWLSEELKAITIENTGEPLVKEVVMADSIFSGDRLQDLPDLFVIWNRDRPFTWRPLLVKSPAIGSVEIKPTYRTGDHTAEAMLILAGKGVHADENFADISLEDIAPTLCSMSGVVLPDTDGQIIPELQNILENSART